MITKVLNIRSEVVYQDKEVERAYRRIVGGLAWPTGIDAGYLVVLGEEFLEDVGLKARRLWLIKEDEGTSIKVLHGKMLEMRAFWGADIWVTDRSQEANMRIFRQANRGLEDALVLQGAPMYGERVSAVMPAVFELLQAERKILTLGTGQVQEAIRILRVEDMKKPISDIPILAALGHAAFEMILRQPFCLGTEPQVKGNWDIYDSQGGQ